MAKKEITEQIVQKKLSELHPFKDHPFKVVDDELMQQTVDSILSVGVLTPLIVREDKDGGYEILSGHRRLHACEILGMDTVPVIVKHLDDDAATIFMVDSNLQRENILPSERALAYKMKMDALKRQGERSDLTSDQVCPKLWAAEKLAQDTGESATQIKRYIRLSNLVPELMEKVDNKEIALTPAVELSFLSEDEQYGFLDAMDYSQNVPSLSQAQRVRKLSQKGECTDDNMREIMSEEKKDGFDRISFEGTELQKYFPKSFSPQKIRETIIKLLDAWLKKRQKQKEETK